MPFSMEEYEKFNKKTENAYYNNNNNNVIYLFGNNSNINADIFVNPYYYKQHPIFGQFNYTNNTSNISLFGYKYDYKYPNSGTSLYGINQYNNNNAYNKGETLFGNNGGLFSNNNSLFG